MSFLDPHRSELPPTLFELIETTIEAQTKTAAPGWVAEIAPIVDDVVEEWRATALADIDIEPGRWEDIYKPAFLWRFYWHLSIELEKISEGHEKVLFDSIREGKG